MLSEDGLNSPPGSREKEREAEDEAGPTRAPGPDARLLSSGKLLQIADCPMGWYSARHAVQRTRPLTRSYL